MSYYLLQLIASQTLYFLHGCSFFTGLSKIEWCLIILTVDSGVGSADCRDGRAAGHDELVVLAHVVRGLGVGQHHVVEVQPGEGGVN